MRVRLNAPAHLDGLIELLASGQDAVIEWVSPYEIEVSLVGSYGEEAMRIELYLRLRAWEAARRAAGARVEILK